MGAKERTAKCIRKHEVKKSLDKYKGIEGIDYVTCQICSKRGLYIDSRHLKTRHNISKEEYINRFPDALLTSEVKNKAQSRPNNKGNLGKTLSGEHRAKFSLAKIGNKNPAWKGGIAKDKYCGIWRDLEYKYSILERDNFKCKNCKCNGDLSIHHINYDKMNCHPWNLITLCRSCNSKANHNRKYWQEIYSHLMMQIVSKTY